MPAYYNENEPYAARWLENLIAARLIPAGDVDARSIVDVGGDDLAGYGQCHFFAGIGGWPAALRLAGWPDHAPIWTGSCPCQPLSSAGQRKGHADERHLWPAFYHLIAKRRPATVFGEQVAGALGREWLAGVRADMEAAGYAVGAADLCAASVGSPHIRQRLFWVADTNWHGGERRECRSMVGAEGSGIRDSARQGHRLRQSAHNRANGEPSRSFWADAEWLACLDGKARRAQPGIFPLAHGVPGRMGKLRAAGNAIVPQVAAEFVAAFMECRP